MEFSYQLKSFALRVIIKSVEYFLKWLPNVFPSWEALGLNLSDKS